MVVTTADSSSAFPGHCRLANVTVLSSDTYTGLKMGPLVCQSLLMIMWAVSEKHGALAQVTMVRILVVEIFYIQYKKADKKHFFVGLLCVNHYCLLLSMWSGAVHMISGLFKALMDILICQHPHPIKDEAFYSQLQRMMNLLTKSTTQPVSPVWFMQHRVSENTKFACILLT